MEAGTDNRRGKRIPVVMHLEISSVFKQNNVHVNNINAPIEVIDISKYGIGFVSKSILPIGFYFDSRLKFEDGRDSINCVVRIVRRKQYDDGSAVYGCEFVGMSPVFDYIFDDTERNYISEIDYRNMENQETEKAGG
ncbi:MAG: PilZ domain-containing protein [Lachnospiraceae bacterium]|nr:PilZ domain-containing protein [Lachnospiraceae bacterium]